jgi:F-type H+-transporting ATPase subunit a
MRLSPDQLIFWQHGFFKLNGTIVFTWGLMLVLAVGSKLITRRLSTDLKRSRWQNLLEIIVTGIEKQISDVGLKHPEKYIGFLGTLFLFVALAALCTVIPGYEPPTGSLSTTAALALCVFVAVPLFGIEEQGFWGYLASYTKPTIIMLPFNIISELSRTLALAVRLFGNMMSGAMIIAILLTISARLLQWAGGQRREIAKGGICQLATAQNKIFDCDALGGQLRVGLSIAGIAGEMSG